MAKPLYRLVLALSVLCLPTAYDGTSLRAEELSPDATADRAAKYAAMLEKRDGDRFWSLVTRLEGLGKNATPALLARLSSSSDKTRLGCAKAILSVGGDSDRNRAFRALRDLIKTAGSADVRVDAIQVYGLTVDDEDLDTVIEELEGLLEDETNPSVLIALGRTLWDLDNSQAARDKLLSLVGSRDPAIRQEAALALAEGGQYQNGTVKDILRRLKKEPTPRGRRAELLYRLMKLETQVDSKIFSGELVPEGTDEGKLLAKREKEIRELEARRSSGAA